MTVPGDAAGPDVPDQLIADALDVAIGIAAAGAKLRPPLPFPPTLRALFKLQRLPGKALAEARRAIEADDVFRERIASVVSGDLVGEAGLLWLQRPPGWQERLAELAATVTTTSDDASLASQLRRAERRRDAAERAAAHALAELSRSRQEASVAATADRPGRSAAAAVEIDRLQEENRRLRTELRHAGDRLRAAVERAERASVEAAAAERRVAEAERIRDEVLAVRAEGGGSEGERGVERLLAGAAWLAGSISEQAQRADELAQVLRRVAGEVSALEPAAREVAAITPRRSPARTRPMRRPVPLPGGVYRTSMEAAEFLVRVSGVIVLVDGYNVAKLGWPLLDLQQQRERCISSAEDVARRFGTDVRIVFDGADVPGGGVGRRLVRVAFTPAGVSADDELRRAVASSADDRAVVVVTDDRAVLDDVRAGGANTLTSRQWLELTGHLSTGR